jgi:hypothetical protein
MVASFFWLLQTVRSRLRKPFHFRTCIIRIRHLAIVPGVRWPCGSVWTTLPHGLPILYFSSFNFPGSGHRLVNEQSDSFTNRDAALI